MSPLNYIVPLSLFVLVPPVLLGTRFIRRSLVPWWVFFLVVATLGWFLVNFSGLAYYETLNNQVKSYTDPPQELVDDLTIISAVLLFAMFFGWFFGLIYSVPWLLIYSLTVGIRIQIQRKMKTTTAAKIS
jgi:UPF0716 family protein affecting phage T7 exclusion